MFQILSKYNFGVLEKLYVFRCLNNPYKKRDRHCTLCCRSPVYFLYYFPASAKLRPSARVCPPALMVMVSVSMFSQKVFATA